MKSVKSNTQFPDGAVAAGVVLALSQRPEPMRDLEK